MESGGTLPILRRSDARFRRACTVRRLERARAAPRRGARLTALAWMYCGTSLGPFQLRFDSCQERGRIECRVAQFRDWNAAVRERLVALAARGDQSGITAR